MIPGEILFGQGHIEINAGADRRQLQVVNTGDRPIQVGSHFHFFEVNKGLSFDREKSYGKRLDIPAGTAVRFEPGETKQVSLIEIGGSREGHGLNGLVEGPLDDPKVREAALTLAAQKGFMK